MNEYYRHHRTSCDEFIEYINHKEALKDLTYSKDAILKALALIWANHD